MKKKIERHIVPPGTDRSRLSDYACRIIQSIPSSKGIKKAVKRGDILINSRTGYTGDWVEPGDTIELIDSSKEPAAVYRIDLEVIYEDNAIALVNKPPGIPVNGNRLKTVEKALPLNLTFSESSLRLPCPRPAHRLDSPTSGILLIAKTSDALMNLSLQFEEKRIKKRYRAIVTGDPGEQGEITTPIDGRSALTRFSTVKVYPSLKNRFITLIDLYPHTGRTHQLRKHMAEIGHPIAGDRKYGPAGSVLRSKGLFLSAVEIEFTHPENGREMCFTIDEPDKFSTYAEREKKRWERYNPG